MFLWIADKRSTRNKPTTQRFWTTTITFPNWTRPNTFPTPRWISATDASTTHVFDVVALCEKYAVAWTHPSLQMLTVIDCLTMHSWWNKRTTDWRECWCFFSCQKFAFAAESNTTIQRLSFLLFTRQTFHQRTPHPPPHRLVFLSVTADRKSVKRKNTRNKQVPLLKPYLKQTKQQPPTQLLFNVHAQTARGFETPSPITLPFSFGHNNCQNARAVKLTKGRAVNVKFTFLDTCKWPLEQGFYHRWTHWILNKDSDGILIFCIEVCFQRNSFKVFDWILLLDPYSD